MLDLKYLIFIYSFADNLYYSFKTALPLSAKLSDSFKKIPFRYCNLHLHVHHQGHDSYPEAQHI